MSKKLTKISLMILTFVFAFCMSIAMLGMGNAYATDGVATFAMQSGASVRVKGDVNGIRFAAVLPHNNADYEYGMILMPTDWLDKVGGAEKLNFNDIEEYDSTKTYGENDVYFARGTNTPKETGANGEGNEVTNAFSLECSFVNINPSNLSRTFTARAYYAPIVEGEADYSQATLTENVAVANVYTVLSTYLVDDEFEDVPVSVQTYVQESVDAVTTVYTKTEIKVDGLTDGVAYRGEDNAISVTATVSKADGSRTIDSGVKVEIERTVEADVDETLSYDLKTQKIALTTSGVFNVKATVGTTVLDTEATVKREGVVITAPDINYDYSTLSAINALNAYSVEVKPKLKLVDPDDTSITNLNLSIAVKDYNVETSWLYFHGSYPSVLVSKSGMRMKDNVTYTATYKDNYGVTYVAQADIIPPTAYTFDTTKETVNADVITLTINNSNQKVVIENVSKTDLNNDIIRFAFDTSNGLTQKYANIIFMETDNITNKVDFGMCHVNGKTDASLGVYTMKYGMKVDKWGTSYYAKDTGAIYKNDNAQSNMGIYFSSCFTIYSLTDYGNYHLMDELYTRGMMGLTIANNTLNMRYFSKCANTTATQAEVFSTTGQTAKGFETWTEFDNVDKVDIQISSHVNKTTPVKVYIDLLGGELVTANNLPKIYCIAR